MEPPRLGNFEYLVLLALFRVGPEAYGAVVRREIQTHTSRHLGISAVYTTLERLEQKGLVRSWIVLVSDDLRLQACLHQCWLSDRVGAPQRGGRPRGRVVPPFTCHVRDSAVWKVPEGIAVRWVNMGDGNVDIDGWIKKFIEAKPGLPIIFANLVSGAPRVHKIYDAAFWTNWSKMPAAEFSRFLAVAEKGKPTPAVPRPPGKTAGQQKIEDLEGCVRYTRDLLTRL